MQFTSPPLDENEAGRKNGAQDQAPLIKWPLAQGQIDEIAAPTHTAMVFLKGKKETLCPGKGRGGKFL